MDRDMLLAEIARSLRATHPDRAEEMIAELLPRLQPITVESGDPPVRYYADTAGPTLSEWFLWRLRLREANLNPPPCVLTLPLRREDFEELESRFSVYRAALTATTLNALLDPPEVRDAIEFVPDATSRAPRRRPRRRTQRRRRS